MFSIVQSWVKIIGPKGALLSLSMIFLVIAAGMWVSDVHLWLWPVYALTAYFVIGSLISLTQERDNLAQLLENLDRLDDEQLVKALDGMVNKKSTDFLHLVTKERRVAEGFQDTVSEIGYSAKELSDTSDMLAENTRQQSQATTSIAAAVTQISHSIEEVSERMREAHASADQTYHDGERGKITIEEVRAYMLESSKCVDETNIQLNELEQRTARVSSVSSVIQEIAEQTNLLSLNAAIEAARAGESGRGFAVVADEVRGLANRSYTSAQEIATIINEMQAQMLAVKTSMDTVMDHTRETLKGADGAQEILAVIAEHTQTVSSMVQVIADVTAQQNGAARDISARVEEVAVTANENSRVAEQSSSIASHLYNLCQQKGQKNAE